MTRKCSHCSNNGHNSRTCPNRGGGGGGLKLFGVQLTGQSIRKSASMGNLTHYSTGSNLLNNPGSPGSTTPDHGPAADDGYGSEDFVAGSSSSSRERKKGVPWTEEEHRMFLLGLHKLGKGDWRGISRNFVISRTPTQVASHAQKYFIRQTNMSKRKRRSSLFDIVADESVDTPMESHEILPVHNDSQDEQLETNNPLPAPPALDEECESMASTNNSIDGDPPSPNPDISQNYPVLCPTYVAPFFPFSFPLWPAYTSEEIPKERHEVLKPTAIHSKTPINVDELVSMSKLSLGESVGLEGLGSGPGPSSISLKLDEGSTRLSAFHANPTADSSSVNAC